MKQHAFENTHLKNCWLEISTLLEITFKSDWNVPHTSFLKLDPWKYHSWEAISAPHSCAIVRVLFKSNDFNISIENFAYKRTSIFQSMTHHIQIPLMKERNEKWSFTCGENGLGHAWAIFETCCMSDTVSPTKSKCTCVGQYWSNLKVEQNFDVNNELQKSHLWVWRNLALY